MPDPFPAGQRGKAILDPQIFPEYALPLEEVQQSLGCRQPYDPKDAVFETYHPPNRAFIMGTDHLGRDTFSRGDAIRDLIDVKLRGRESQSES